MQRRPVIYVDFDGTLAENAYPDWGAIKPGAVEAIQEMIEAGCSVTVYSVRLNLSAFGQVKPMHQWHADRMRMRQLLDDAGLELVQIEERDKPFFDVLIDDRAIRFPRHRKHGWKRMAQKVLAAVG